MPIKAYVGQMRSGKTYEVVSNVILQGLRDGRRVVSNIAGLDYEKMRELLLSEGIPVEKIGKLVAVDHEQVQKPSFWRTDKDLEAGFDSFIQPGDLVALDEVWRFWKRRGEIEPRAMNFVRMHGHMSHPETGYICEIALISQLVTDINENVRGVIQETYKMTKQTSVGSDKTYRVDIYSGGTVARHAFLRQEFHRYNPKYFEFYKSHSQQAGAAAVEKNIDTRGNVLRGAMFKFVLPGALLLGFFGVWYLVRMFRPPAGNPVSVSADSQISLSATPESSEDPRFPAHRNPGVSNDWRLVGWFVNRSGQVSILAVDSEQRYRHLYDPPAMKAQGWSVSVKSPEGEMMTFYSGEDESTARNELVQ